MDEYKVKLSIFSPRWGHDDTYEVLLSKNQLVISQGPNSAICTYKENVDHEWSGERLDKILSNDHIFAPLIFQSLLEHAWISWRNSELDNTAINEELQELANWLNIISNAKPKTEFWSTYF